MWTSVFPVNPPATLSSGELEHIIRGGPTKSIQSPFTFSAVVFLKTEGYRRCGNRTSRKIILQDTAALTVLWLDALSNLTPAQTLNYCYWHCVPQAGSNTLNYCYLHCVPQAGSNTLNYCYWHCVPQAGSNTLNYCYWRCVP